VISPGSSAPRLREWAALAAVLFVAVVWLNQGGSLRSWLERDARVAAGAEEISTLDAIRRPFGFLYRRALDEEMYFATASATLGEPYDREIFRLRGASSLPPIDVPADGRFHVPYTEIPFEYPPPNVPFVVLPRLIASTLDGYTRLLAGIMGVLLAASAVLALRSSPGRPDDRAARLGGFALLLLAHGAIAIQRLDALVALVLVLAVQAATLRRDRLLGFWCGMLFAIKVVPVLAGLAIVAASGPLLERRRLARLATGGLLGVGLGLGPMIVLSSGGLGAILRYHAARGLHVESSLGVVYGAVKAILGKRERSLLDYGSFNFHGGLADALAKVGVLLLLTLVTIVVLAAARRREADRTSAGSDDDDEARTARILLAALGGVLAIWLGGKVFSPQYLTWALPLAIAVPGPGWRRIALLYGGVLVLSQLYYRGYYDHVYNQLPLGIATMVVRLGLLVVFFQAIVAALHAGRGRGRSAEGSPVPSAS
jgi:hypothetical protein